MIEESGSRLRDRVRGARTLRHKRLADETADTLRDMILVGDIRPDERFTQDEIAAIMGVSTMPVREALLKLAHEGLVLASPNRSFRVAQTTRDDIWDIYWMHSTLAGELAARASVRADAGLLDQLRSLLQENLAALHSEDVLAMESTNWAFHRAINQAAASPKLGLILRRMLPFIPQHFYARVPQWRTISETGHARIVAALERRDPEGARVAASEHVLEAGQLVIQHFSDKGHWLPPGRP